MKWIKIKGFESYGVNKKGQIKNLIKGNILKPVTGSGGYHQVSFNENGKRINKKIHIIMAETFLNHTPCGFKVVVDHVNNVKTDNRLLNLQLTTNRHNSSKDIKNKTSRFTGVTWDKTRKKWETRYKIGKKQFYIGRFDSEIEAAEAYAEKIKNLSPI